MRAVSHKRSRKEYNQSGRRRSIHLISRTCKCQFIGETFVYLRPVPTARLGIKTANKTILSDIKTRVDNRAGRFRLIKGRLIPRVNTDAHVIALSRLHLLYPPRNEPCY